MIWNDEVLFIHAPKTAGMSLTALLMRGLRGRVYMTGHDKQEKRGRQTLLKGKRHESMAEAATFLEVRGKRLSDFEKIFVVMREPYTLEISRYNYLRIGHSWDRGPAQDIARRGVFKDYLRHAPFFGFSPPRLDIYYHVFGAIPENAVFLKFEHLSEDMAAHLSPFLDGSAELPHENRTGASWFEDYYDAETEALCYQRHRWFFDKGFYRRRQGMIQCQLNRNLPHPSGREVRSKTPNPSSS